MQGRSGRVGCADHIQFTVVRLGHSRTVSRHPGWQWMRRFIVRMPLSEHGLSETIDKNKIIKFVVRMIQL